MSSIIGPDKNEARRSRQVGFTRLTLAGISLPLGILCAVHFPEQLTRADGSITAGEKNLYTAIVVLVYFAIPALSWKSLRASGLLANLFCLLFTPYIAILLLSSEWTASSENAAHWLWYVILGNIMLFILSIITLILSFLSRQESRP
jgi:hypothetical protein